MCACQGILQGMAFARAEGRGDISRTPGAAAEMDVREAFKSAALRWHPDKFLARFGQCLAPSDADLIMQRVASIAQRLNHEWQAHCAQIKSNCSKANGP